MSKEYILQYIINLQKNIIKICNLSEEELKDFGIDLSNPPQNISPEKISN